MWADIDNDGYLDLFVANESGSNQLFLNNGDGTFKDISHSSGIDHRRFTKAVVSADYDNDGYPDFYLSNYSGNNILYHNNHDNTLPKWPSRRESWDPGSFPSWFFDYDNDGWPDLLVNSYFISVDESVRDLPRPSPQRAVDEALPQPARWNV